jgi:hypothetical protein
VTLALAVDVGVVLGPAPQVSVDLAELIPVPVRAEPQQPGLPLQEKL